jgi:hypothetical protein
MRTDLMVLQISQIRSPNREFVMVRLFIVVSDVRFGDG